MEHFHQDHPYISDLDNLDISPQHNPYDDFQSPRFPATPSYNGSYQNSPYSAASELDFDPKHDALGLFDTDLVSATDDYDPASYDPPASAGLLMFDGAFMSGVTSDDQHISLSVTHAEDRNIYDQPSPASSPGQDNDRSSPASSVSDHPAPSPHINFTSLHVESPYLPSIAIPSEHASPQMKPQSPPTLHIPDDPQPRPTINAPGVHIVPATPVSGGVYRNQGSLIAQGSQPSAQATSGWADDQAPGQYPSGLSFNFPAHQQQQSQQQGTEDYLLPPSPSRIRAKSDTSLRPPQWGLPQSNQHQQQQQHSHQQQLGDGFGGRGGTVNMTDVLPPVSDLYNQHSRPSSSSSTSALQASFLPSSSQYPQRTQDFLSPDFGAQALRRARSDGGGARHTRQVRSEDLSRFMPQAQSHGQYLMPDSGVALLPISRGAGGGHHRRASSGSREAWSPYPSPSASPRAGVEPLPSVGSGRHHLVGDDYGSDYPGSAGRGRSGRGEPEAVVAKPNVTTTATADASMKRRINDAKFACPVPGCGSTFTRHFNLKGHMRSHNDEKPFQCKWPGCGKGFARQHDCKRHEQLHSNHRPFTCEGCKKPFARLDALNRHLRSEGGSGCVKAQEALGLSFALQGEDNQHAPKMEPEGTWDDVAGMGGGFMM